MKNNEIMLTVKMLAYNHEKYIAQAIESILSQKTEYRYELLIGEDCSTDNTRKIIQDYEEKYPEIIRVIYQKHNQGCTKNSYSLDLHARGKYIAGCEGDDFWCDDSRIQRDIDYLKTHPEYVGICHKCKIVGEDGREIDSDTLNNREKFWEFDKDVFTLQDYEKWLTPGHGCAQTGRNIIKENDLDFSIVYKASKHVGDRTHLLIHIVEGDIRCMKDIVACYRYRTSENNNNFMAVQKQKNIKDEDYLMMVRLEQWALNNKNIKLNLDAVKKDRFAGSVVIWIKNPTKENRAVIHNIIRYSKEPVRYLYYLIKIIVTKQFYWKVLKTDKLIKL